MSGGVDSSVSACLLRQQGYGVEGVFMALAQPDLDRQLERVKAVAAKIGVPLRVLDLAEAFRRCVLDYFADSYFAGKTPNPCMVCNPNIKFGRLLSAVRGLSFGLLATGHYVRVEKEPGRPVRLLRGMDPQKDQSYFLSQLRQEQLRHLLFPLGAWRKTEVYQLAASFGLAGVHGSESQDVCFLKDTEVGLYLDRVAPGRTVPGEIVDLQGRRLGAHQGIHHYTIGQRRGLALPDSSPYYVVALEARRHLVVVGKKEDLWQRRLSVGGVNWLAGAAPSLPLNCTVRIRYRHQPAPAIIQQGAGDCYDILFEDPQRAITPGQFAVFYHGEEVLGGGEILASRASEQASGRLKATIS